MSNPLKYANPAYVFFQSQLRNHPTRQRPDTPDFPGSFPFSQPIWRDKDWPDAHVHGWAAHADDRRGTLIAAHGFLASSHQNGLVRLARHAHKLGWSVALPDLRMHGRSHDACPGLGIPESEDLRAVLDWLIEDGFPSPYVVAGYSLGALAASNLCARDDRVSGGLFLSAPAWPWDATGIHAMVAAPLGVFINAWYGRDVLGEGDLRRLGAAPRKPVVYAIGADDRYGVEHLRTVFRSSCWGGGDEMFVHRGRMKSLNWTKGSNLFIECDGADHSLDFDDYPTVVQALDELLARVVPATRSPATSSRRKRL